MLDTKLEFESHCVSNFGRVKIEMRSNKIFTASFTSHYIRKYIDGSSKVYAPVGSDSEGVIISHDQSHEVCVKQKDYDLQKQVCSE